MAALISLRSDIVSIQMRSTPPATSDAACSRKTSTASSYSSVPSGATISPLGPMSPATSAVPPAAWTSARRRMAAVLLSSSTRSCRPCSREPQPVATERVGQQDPRAGSQVAALDATHDVRVGQVPGLGRVAELEAGGEQHRAHRPVGEDRAALVEDRRGNGRWRRHRRWPGGRRGQGTQLTSTSMGVAASAARSPAVGRERSGRRRPMAGR